MSDAPITRRQALGSFAAMGGVLTLASRAAAQSPAQPPARTRSLRFAHLTDSHVQPERAADQGLTQCLAHLNAQQEPPQLLITGGDLIMDAFEQERARSAALFDLYARILKDHCPTPIQHTLGNHDIWGWNQRKSKTTSAEPQWGKKWALDALDIDKPYRVLEHDPWRIIILDSVSPLRGDGYVARLDPDQLAWLDATLAQAARDNRHVAVVSHIPILSVTVFDLDARVDEDQDWRMRGGVMHVDAKEITALFLKHACVRLAVSGHIHKLDRCTFQNVTYICDGAVSGAWWKGPQNRCPEGYGIFDLYSDGSFDHAYHTYNWTARE